MGGYRETGEEDMDSASMDVDAPIPMDPPLSHDPHLVTMDETDETMGTVKTEETELHLQISTAPDSLLAGTEPAQASFEEPLLVDDEEEQKAKPILKMSYQAFNIHGQCLCVIVEPCPLIRSATKPMSLVREGLVGPQAPRIVSSDQLPSGSTSLRERTPLFLPDDDGERGVTPAPLQRVLPPAPLFNQEPSSDDDESIGGMFALSQVLQSVGGYAAGTAEDDDEIDGAVFFGDADETREL